MRNRRDFGVNLEDEPEWDDKGVERENMEVWNKRDKKQRLEPNSG